MKSNDEMVKSLLERREEYGKKQAQKKKTLVRAATSIGCACLVALLGFGAVNSGIFGAPKPEPKAETSLNSVESSAAEAKDKIVIQKIESVSGDGQRKLSGPDLKDKDFVEMNKEDLTEYFGTKLFPTVPADLEEQKDRHGIYKENGGTGNVYYDGEILNYSNEDFSRSINIEIKKNALPATDCAFFDSLEETSVINNTEVAIAQTDDGYYYAQFITDNVGFRIIANGLTESEFVETVSSLI